MVLSTACRANVDTDSEYSAISFDSDTGRDFSFVSGSTALTAAKSAAADCSSSQALPSPFPDVHPGTFYGHCKAAIEATGVKGQGRGKLVMWGKVKEHLCTLDPKYMVWSKEQIKVNLST